MDLLSTLYNMLKTEIPNDLVFKRSKLKGLKIWMKFLAKVKIFVYDYKTIFIAAFLIFFTSTFN